MFLFWSVEPGNEVSELVASFPGHVGGGKWPENEATAVKVGELWYVLGSPHARLTVV